MALDGMMGLAMRGMGIDPEMLLKQAAEIGAAFVRMETTQRDIMATQRDVLANQHAIMVALGLSVPAPDQAMLAVIDAFTQKHVETQALPAPLDR